VDVRWAKPDGAEELVRLRQMMWDGMGVESGDAWHEAAAVQLRAGVADGTFFAAVIDSPNGDGLAAGGVGTVWQGLIGPGDGRFGYIQSMATDPRWRRRGLARLVLDALIGRFGELRIATVRLHASRFGEPLYRSVGFTDPGHLELQLRLTSSPVPASTS
jgi:GNAT superfamily N-acetyltransferase